MYHVSAQALGVYPFDDSVKEFVKYDHFCFLVSETLRIFKDILDKEGKPYTVMNEDELIKQHKSETDRSIEYFVYDFDGEFLLTRHNVVAMFSHPTAKLTIQSTHLDVPPNHFIPCQTDAIAMALDKSNMEETWGTFNRLIDDLNDSNTIAKIKLLRIFNYMSDFFDYMVVWNTKKKVDTFIKYFIRKKTINDYNRAFLIVEPNIQNNVMRFLTKMIREDPLYSDIGFTFSITNKDTWKSVQMVVYTYLYEEDRSKPVAAHPFELQIVTPQVMAYEHFSSGHTLYEMQRLPDEIFGSEWMPVWKFLLEKGIDSVEVQNLVKSKYDMLKAM